METITENHKDSKYGKQDIMWYSVSNNVATTQFLHLKIKGHCRQIVRIRRTRSLLQDCLYKCQESLATPGKSRHGCLNKTCTSFFYWLFFLYLTYILFPTNCSHSSEVTNVCCIEYSDNSLLISFPSFSLFQINFYFMYMCALPAYMSVKQLLGVPNKKTWYPQEQKLEIVVNNHMSPGN